MIKRKTDWMSLPVLCLSLFAACSIVNRNAVAASEDLSFRNGENGFHYLTDSEMAKVLGGSGTQKCCAWFYPTTSVGCSDFATCNEAVWGCKKIDSWCSLQSYSTFDKCKDDPQHPSWKCGTVYLSGVPCIDKLRDQLPADGQCGATQNHGVACNTVVIGPCGMY